MPKSSENFTFARASSPMIKSTSTLSEIENPRTPSRNVLPIKRLLVNQFFFKICALGVIKARDEFKDLDIVFPWNAPYLIKRQAHYSVRPFYVRHNDEEIRVTLESVDTHFKREYPYFLNL